MEPRKDLRVYFAPSTRTAEMLSGVFRLPVTYLWPKDIQQQKNRTTYDFRKVENGRLVFASEFSGHPFLLPFEKFV